MSDTIGIYGTNVEPQPYQNRILLYSMHFFFAFVSRMWDMANVLLIADLTNNSLFFVALANLLGSASVFFFMPYIGREFIDKTDRFIVIRTAIILKAISISLAYFLCAALSGIETDVIVIVYMLPILCSVAQIGFRIITTSVERDWIVVLSDNDSKWLTETNGNLTNIDLACSSVAPAVTGVLFYVFSYQSTAILLLFLNASSALALYYFLTSVYHSWPALASRHPDYKPQSPRHTGSSTPLSGGNGGDEKTHNKTNKERELYKMKEQEMKALSHSLASDDGDKDADADKNRKSQLSAGNPNPISNKTNNDSDNQSKALASTSVSLWDTISDFRHSGCMGVMLAYSFLYFTVLSFGAMMTVYLRWAGVSDYWIGVTRGVNALFGMLGSQLFKLLAPQWGLEDTAFRAIWYQCALITTAALSFYICSKETSVLIVIITVLCSRTGLWLFDLCSKQIAQETIPEHLRGSVNGLWMSIVAFFNMSSFIAAIMIPDPNDFYMLTTISACFVFLAAATYTLTHDTYRASVFSLCGMSTSNNGGGDAFTSVSTLSDSMHQSSSSA